MTSSDFSKQAAKSFEKPEILFARVDIKELMEKVEADKAANAQAQPAAEPAEEAETEEGIDIEPKAEITFDDFEKLQFQVGEIIACEAVKKSKKLLCSQVKIGNQVRQIVSGIRKQLFTGRNGRQESHGCDQPETGDSCGCEV